VGGDQKTIARLESLKPDPRPELRAAFEAVGDSAIELLVLPTPTHREIARQMLPRLPKEVGEAPNTVITQGLVWAAVGINPPPNTVVRLVIQSENQKAAAALGDLWATAIQSLAEEKAVQDVAPGFTRIAEVLTFAVQQDRLVSMIDAKQGSLDRLLAAAAPMARKVRTDSMKQESMQKLKELALAMHNYHDRDKRFPPHASYGPDGKPLLSWRVLILPYLVGNKLYEQFRLDEPWDSEHNRKLIDQMPDIYRSPAQSATEKSHTTYVVPVGGGAVFGGKEGMRLQDITDGTAYTILVVEVPPANAVIWTKPDDLAFDPKEPAKGLGEVYAGRFAVAFADGSVQLVPTETLKNADVLRGLFTAAGGVPVERP
jgi:hypothetical protein